MSRIALALALLVAPLTASAADWCEVLGWYGDGICDADCPEPDPDCEEAEPPSEPPSEDWCEVEGWYGDGICDADCPQPDPDCQG